MPVPTTSQTFYVHSLPHELLASLKPRKGHAMLAVEVAQSEDLPIPAVQDDVATTSTGPGGRACNVCLDATFANVDEQRSHFRSDWHRYNLKVRLNGGQPVDEGRFAQLVEGLEDSLSGTASSEDEEEDSDDAVSTLVSRNKPKGLRSSRSPSPDAITTQPQSALTWFHLPPSTQFGIYRTIFPLGSSQYLEELQRLQSGHGEGRKWAVFMTAGGHFAGAIVRVSRSDEEIEAEREEAGNPPEVEAADATARRRKKAKPKAKRPEVEVLFHKTFHRYTTRRKQGGSQGLHDNAKSKAKSAGAQLRRYGEQALRDDIQGLLKSWQEELDDCERIWFRASWLNRRMFMTENGGVFEKSDDRLRGFPFPTRRPTQAEAIRCVNELVRVKVTHFTEDELREQDEAYIASLPKPKAKPSVAAEPSAPSQPLLPARPALTDQQVELRVKWLRALDMVERGKVETLKTFLDKEGALLGGMDARVPNWMGYDAGGDDTEERARGWTLLMAATAAKQEEVVRWLLEDARADPTLDITGTAAAEDVDQTASDLDADADADADAPPLAPSGRRTAYDLARAGEVRTVFRRCAGAHPDWWDWLGTGPGGARVPSVLTREMEESRDEKKKARRKGLKDKIREREAQQKAKEVAQPPPPPPPTSLVPARQGPKEDATGPRRLGGGTTAGEGISGLTPEMRAKVERERRARAAEARLKALSGR